MRLNGIYVAMLTPLDENGKIKEDELRKLTRFYIEKEVDGLFVVSSVGEKIYLPEDEVARGFSIVADENKGKMKLFANITSTNAIDAISLGRVAEKLNYDAVVSAPPYYYNLTEKIVYNYYNTITENLNVPLIIYNIPIFAFPLSSNLIDRLSKNPKVLAIKDSSGNMVEFMHNYEIIKENNPNLNIMIGRDEIFLHALISGADSCMLGAAGIVPEVFIKIYELFKENKLKEAMILQRSILKLLRICFKPAFPNGFKLALEQRGFNMGYSKRVPSEEDKKLMLELKPIILDEINKILELVKSI